MTILDDIFEMAARIEVGRSICVTHEQIAGSGDFYQRGSIDLSIKDFERRLSEIGRFTIQPDDERKGFMITKTQ